MGEDLRLEPGGFLGCRLDAAGDGAEHERRGELVRAWAAAGLEHPRGAAAEMTGDAGAVGARSLDRPHPSAVGVLSVEPLRPPVPARHGLGAAVVDSGHACLSEL